MVATVEGETERMTLECHWAGGRRTRHRLRRSVRRVTQLARHDEMMARAEALFCEGLRPPAIARTLAAEGWLAPHRRPVTENGVRSWLHRRGWLPDGRHRPSAVVERAEGELTVAELSARLGVPEGTIHRRPHKGLMPARKTTALNRDLWLVRLKNALAHDRQRRRRPTTIAPVP